MGAKLSISFGLVILLTALVTLVGFFANQKLSGGVDRMNKEYVQGLSIVGDFQAIGRDLRIRGLRVSQAETNEDYNKQKADLFKLRADWDKAEQVYKGSISNEKDQELYDRLMAANRKQNEFVDEVMRLREAGKVEAAQKLMDDETRIQFRDEVVPMLTELKEFNDTAAEEFGKELDALANTAEKVLLIAGAIAVALGIGMVFILTRSILPYVKSLSEKLSSLNSNCLTDLGAGLKAMEQGDLTVNVVPVTQPVQNPSGDELGQMCSTFNEMLGKMHATISSYQATRQGLGRILNGIQTTAESVAATGTQLEGAAIETGSAAGHIASTITQVSASAEESARSTQQIAVGSESLAAAAERAAQAVERLDETILALEKASQDQIQATTEAKKTALEGSSAVSRTIESMEKIRGQMEATSVAILELGRKGEQIGVIVQTIEGIAQQTNLLALNAAIEAARAGDQGRGFAVVADEVRKLAEDSTSSAKQIAELISAVQQGVDTAVKAMEASGVEIAEGTGLAAEAGTSLTAIQTATENVAKAAASGESTVTVMKGEFKQVSEAIASAAAISEETAAGAEEMSAAAQEVSASAQTVSAAVQQQRVQIDEVSASAEKLNGYATELKDSVSRFRIEEGSTGHRKAA